jgi:trehalose/maltose hydrolase-like predicted phosphorylase
MNFYKQPDKLWCITENKLNKDTTKGFEGMFAQGSGYLQIRGTFEEGLAAAPQNEEYMRMPANVTIEKPHHPRSKSGVYIPGITGTHPLLKEEIVNLPNFLVLEVYADEEKLDMDTSDILNYSRSLDLRDGVLYREFDWNTKFGAMIKCEYTRFVSRNTPNIVVQSVRFTADKDCQIDVKSDINTEVRTNGFNHFIKVSKSYIDNKVLTQVETDNQDKVLMMTEIFSENFDFTADEGDYSEIILTADKTVTINKLSCAMTTRDLTDEECSFDTLSEKLSSSKQKFNSLYNDNAKEWIDMWNRSKVIIDGDENAQRAVNFSIYHLLRASNYKDNRTAICAKGFAGEAYFGHFFWDTEIYLIPFFLYTNPEIAKSLVEFRINTLNGAKRNAKVYGYDGAKYPWESSITGDEQCPNWQYADNEVHINADVALGIWHYFCATGDEKFLVKSIDVLIETAKYWTCRAEFKANGEININGVMGPDEYCCFSNNNAYTNYMVVNTLKYTLEAVKIAEKYNVTTDLSEEQISKIKLIIKKLPLKCNKSGILMQCDGFDKFEELDFDKIWTDKSKPFGQFISQERNYRSKALKQADVLMIPYLFNKAMDKETITKNYNYYYKYTTHDSSLSCIIHSIICAHLGDTKAAYNLFNKSLSIDLGTGAAEGIHIANCGGIWQGIVIGFAGMKWSYENDKLEFEPNLPKEWKRLEFNIHFKGKFYNVSIADNNTVVTEI